MEPFLRGESPVNIPHLPVSDETGSDFTHLPFSGFGIATIQNLGDSIFSSINDAILVIDRFGVIDRVNPATCELTGFSAGDLVGSSIEVLTRNKRLFGRLFKETLG